jgi:YidC/Oxa1 family membrane protein insertase
MEKRLILAIVLSLAVLLAFQILFAPPPPEAPPAPPPEAVLDRAPDIAERADAPPGPGVPPTAADGMAPRKESPLRQVVVETPLYTAAVTTGDGGIRSFHLNRYKDMPGPRGVPLDITGNETFRPLPFDLYMGDSQPHFPVRPVFSTDAPDIVTVAAGEERSLRLSWESASGVTVAREYVFSGDRYDFELRIDVRNDSPGTIRFRPGLQLSQDYAGELGSDAYAFRGAVVKTPGGAVERFDLKSLERGKVDHLPVRWAAADAKYFALVVMPDQEWTVAEADRVGETGMRLTAAAATVTLGPGEAARLEARGFAGPKEDAVLKSVGRDLEGLVDYGWFSILAKPLVWLLKASNRVTGNYGIDIIILTIIIKIVFYPLTKKSMASMKKMQDLAPVITKLREKYKGDQAKLNQEMMNLYKTYKINPFGGCLPMILQIPVFIALYKGLMVAIELRHAPFALWINDLSAPEQLWDIDIAGFTLPIRLLPILMGASMFLQQKMMPATGMDPAQQKIMMFLPLIFTFMFWGFPTGLVIYWLVNNVLSIGQQMIHNRQAAAAVAKAA